MAKLTKLAWLDLEYNQITDISPLVDNAGFGVGDTIALTGNPLSDEAVSIHIPALTRRGVEVFY